MELQVMQTDRPGRSDRLSLREVELLQQELDEVRRAVLQEELPQRSKRPRSTEAEAKQRLVSSVIQLRRERGVIFEAGLFGEPAWDILLELYLADLRHVRHSVSGICRLSDSPSTTALRWISKLESSGLITKEGDVRDARRSWVKLTNKGFASLDALLERLEGLGERR